MKLTGYKNQFRFDTFIGFLASNPNLEVATFDVQFVDSVWGYPGRVISLSRLRQLLFAYAKPLDARRLLSSIKFPRGVHLELVYSGGNQFSLLQSSLPAALALIHEALTPITVVKLQSSPNELHLLGSTGLFSFRTSHIAAWYPELRLFPTASVRELHVNNEPWPLASAFLDSLLTQVPALEALVVTNTKSWAPGIFDSLAGQPLLCPSLETIAFFNCTLTPQITRELGGVLAKRKGSEATWVYRVVIVSSVGTFPDHTLVQQLRQQVPCVDVRAANELPDLP